MVSSAQVDPCFEHTFAGVRYTVAYNRETQHISYLFTEDDKFKTEDGLKVGDEIAVSRRNCAWPGWEMPGPTTTDGWRPIVGWNAEVKLTDGTFFRLGGNHAGRSSGYAATWF